MHTLTHTQLNTQCKGVRINNLVDKAQAAYLYKIGMFRYFHQSVLRDTWIVREIPNRDRVIIKVGDINMWRDVRPAIIIQVNKTLKTKIYHLEIILYSYKFTEPNIH